MAKSYVGAPPLGRSRSLLGEILDPPLYVITKFLGRLFLADFSKRNVKLKIGQEFPCETYFGHQWRIQDFPRGGGANSRWGGGRQRTILPKFPRNCMKLKEFGPSGGASKLLLCRFATGHDINRRKIETESVEDNDCSLFAAYL